MREVQNHPRDSRQSRKSSSFFLLRLAALRAIYNHASRMHPELQRPNPVRGEYHLFTLLSACRREALSSARWEHLDVGGRALHIPKPKGGSARAFDIPLSREMLRCLARARRVGRRLQEDRSKEWIFPSIKSKSGHIAECKERGMKTGHALRHTWRTLAQQAGVSEIDAKLIMNHAIPGANAGYVSWSALWPHLPALQEKVSAFIVERCS